jgi:flagellar basal body-associated protein FliL
VADEMTEEAKTESTKSEASPAEPSASGEAAAKTEGTESAPASSDAPPAGAPSDGHSGGHAEGEAQKAPLLQSLKEKAHSVFFFLKNYLTRPNSYLSVIPNLFTSLFHYDLPTRRMSLMFMVSLMSAVVVMGISANRFIAHRKAVKLLEARLAAQQLKEQELLRQEESKRQVNTVSLGSFTLEIKPEPPVRRGGMGIVNMAEVELVLLCDSEETCEHISRHKVQVRNQLTQVFLPLDREEVMSKEGKRRIRAAVVKKLNSWLNHGKVNDLYFSKLIIH